MDFRSLLVFWSMFDTLEDSIHNRSAAPRKQFVDVLRA